MAARDRVMATLRLQKERQDLYDDVIAQQDAKRSASTIAGKSTTRNLQEVRRKSENPIASTTPRKPDHTETQDQSTPSNISHKSQNMNDLIPSPTEESEEACTNNLDDLKISLFQIKDQKDQRTPNIMSTERTKRTTSQTKATTERVRVEDE